MIKQVVARVGGLGFLDALFPPTARVHRCAGQRRRPGVGAAARARCGSRTWSCGPRKDEVWRAVEALLAPEGRACSEVHALGGRQDAAQSRAGFRRRARQGAAPVIAPGDGYPTLAVRLFEPGRWTPGQIVQWGVFPAAVLAGLTEAVGSRLRAMVIGGTGTGKTTLLSALCHGIPLTRRAS